MDKGGLSNRENKKLEEFRNELLEKVEDPFHKELVQAFQGEDPRTNMLSRLHELLREMIKSEDS